MMKIIIVCVVIFVVVIPAFAAGKGQTGVPALKPGYGNVPLYFVPNHGQVDPQVRFHAATPGFNLWLTHRAMVFDWGGKSNRDVSRLEFIGASASPVTEAMDMTRHRVNFLRGGDKSKWRSNIPTSRAVLYKNLYPGIRLKVYGKERQLEYDWIVEPGADPSVIKWRYSNVKGTGIDDSGDLRIKTTGGVLVHKAPVSFQVIDDRRVPVRVTFKKIAPATYGFCVGQYDKTHPLIIDPVVLAYSTYLGGSDYTSGWDIAVDGSGCAYVTGFTRSLDFPVVAPAPGPVGINWYDGFVTKFSADGAQLLYSTYLGGSENDFCRAITVDGSGSAYVAGGTSSHDFPIKDAFQGSRGDQYGGGDAFLTKLSADGSQLVYSTFLGGSGWDAAKEIVVDAGGSAIVAGFTDSSNFPVKNALKESRNVNFRDEGFITKFSPDGRQLVFSTYFGGSESDSIYGIAVDGSGIIYVSGSTSSYDFPTINPLHEFKGGIDSFVSKISADGSQMIFSTFLGGTGYDKGRGIAVDDEGNIYVTGDTTSEDFPLVNPFQDHYVLGGEYNTSEDCFVAKIDGDDGQLIYSTYLGGSSRDVPESIAVDAVGSAYVMGHTISYDFPVLNAIKETITGIYDDTFVFRLSPRGDSLIFSTLIGGTDYDKGMGLDLDIFGNAYITGFTHSDDFPVLNAFQAVYPPVEGHSAFVTKILNLFFFIEAERRLERGWLIRKEFGYITLSVGNIGNMPISRFVFYRRDSTGMFQPVKEVSASEVEGGYVFIDWQIDKNRSYTYKVEALDADGNVIAATGEKTI